MQDYLNCTDTKKWTPLYYAIDGSENGFPDIVGSFILIKESLVKNCGDVNHQDIKGITPLQLSSYKGQDDNVEILLKYKADPNIKDCLGSKAKVNERKCFELCYYGRSN